MIVQPPYLIQRAEIIKPLVDPNERISNAVKFTPQGRIVVSLRAPQVSNGMAQVELSVQDTGIGMGP